MIKEDFGFLKDDVLAVLMFGSVVRGEETARSDVDICVVAPDKDPEDILKSVFREVDVEARNYDVHVFEELPLHVKMQVIKNHDIVYTKDKYRLYEYFYYFRKLWDDQKFRNEVTEEDMKKILRA